MQNRLLHFVTGGLLFSVEKDHLLQYIKQHMLYPNEQSIWRSALHIAE